MIKFGRMTNPGMDIIKEIKLTKKLGFDFVEIGIETPTDAGLIVKRKAQIKKELKKFRHAAIAHTAWWYDLSSPYEAVRLAWLKQAKVDISAAGSLGINLVNFHFLVLSKLVMGNDKTRKLVLDNYVKSLSYLIQFAKKKQITLMLENGEEKFEYYDYVMKRVPELKVHFDIGHANINGGINKIKKFLDYYKKRIEHIHMHDNHGKSDEHLGLGKGNIKWKEVAFLLKKAHYEKTVTFETYRSQKDLISSRKYFEKLWNN